MSGDGDEDLVQYEHELDNLTVEITEIISKITTPNKKAKMNPAEVTTIHPLFLIFSKGLEKLQSRLKMAKTGTQLMIFNLDSSNST